MKVLSALVNIFRRKWVKPSAFSYDEFEITDFDHQPYFDYGPEMEKENNL